MIKKDINWIKAFLKSKTAEGLQNLMLENNLKRKCYHDYQIIFTGTNWYAWFEMPLDDVIMEKVNVQRQRSRTK